MFPLCRCLDVDCDGFLGGGDLQHWYRMSELFLDTQVQPAIVFVSTALLSKKTQSVHGFLQQEEATCMSRVVGAAQQAVHHIVNMAVAAD